MCFQICLEGIFNRTIAALQKKQKIFEVSNESNLPCDT